MLTFLELGRKGNLGNQLFQVASTMGLAKKHGHGFVFPNWNYSPYFQYKFDSNIDNKDWLQIDELYFNHYDWHLTDGDFSINGWLQSELYFKNIDIKSIFKFNQKFEKDLLEKHTQLFTKPGILITIRRGDFVNNKLYFQLSYKYYFTALVKYFPDFKNYNIIFSSDDINYCKHHFSFIDNAFFLEDLNAIEQLCLGSKFDHYIISNSTFSWWLAWLGEKKETKVICPIRNFDGYHSSIFDEKDYFPKRWTTHDEKKHAISLKYFKLIIKDKSYKSKDRIMFFFNEMFLNFRKEIIINYLMKFKLIRSIVKTIKKIIRSVNL